MSASNFSRALMESLFAFRGHQLFELCTNVASCFFPGGLLFGELVLFVIAGDNDVIARQHRREERLEPEVIGLQDGVELVIVALGAAHRQAEEGLAGDAGDFVKDLLAPLLDVGCVVLIGIEPVEACSRRARPGCWARARRRRSVAR